MMYLALPFSIWYFSIRLNDFLSESKAKAAFIIYPYVVVILVSRSVISSSILETGNFIVLIAANIREAIIFLVTTFSL